MLVLAITVSTIVGFSSITIMVKLFACDMEPGTPANDEMNKYFEERRAA